MIGYIADWLQSIQDKHNVNPYIFGIIFLICAGPWWYSLYKIVDNIKKKQIRLVVKWLIIIGFLTIAPFLYVAIFGRNLPISFWFIIAAIVVMSFINLAKKIRQDSQKIVKEEGNAKNQD